MRKSKKLAASDEPALKHILRLHRNDSGNELTQLSQLRDQYVDVCISDSLVQKQRIRSRVTPLEKKISISETTLDTVIDKMPVILKLSESESVVDGLDALMDGDKPRVQEIFDRNMTRHNFRHATALQYSITPDYTQLIVYQRDRIMEPKLQKLATQRNIKGSIVAIVGAAHMDGIIKCYLSRSQQVSKSGIQEIEAVLM